VGKSIIAAVLCDQFPDNVLAVHFCKHSLPDRKNASRMIRSLAFQLSQRVPSYRDELAQRLPQLGDLSDKDELTLFDILLSQPLANLPTPAQFKSRKAVMLIDALDEAVDASGTGNKLLGKLIPACERTSLH